MGNQRWLGSSSHHFGVRLQRCNFPGFSNLPLVVIPGLLSWSWSWSTSGIDNIRRAGGDVTRLGVVVVLGGGGRKGLRTRRRQRRRRRLLGSARGVSTAYDAVVLGQHLVCQSRRIGWPSSIHHKVLIQKILRCRAVDLQAAWLLSGFCSTRVCRSLRNALNFFHDVIVLETMNLARGGAAGAHLICRFGLESQKKRYSLAAPLARAVAVALFPLLLTLEIQEAFFGEVTNRCWG